ncbi:MAG TPA: adenylate/guanylate cyclase domain-containing protein [Thermoanaerobaculia bacterium]|nr:adenylate/guanylate cyclase domain-containing protein [Thermoanaerobaculia bacterium]
MPAPRPSRLPLLLGLGASLVALGLQGEGWLTRFEAVWVDQMMASRGRQAADPRIAIVAIDAESVDAYGQFPWPRTRIAELVDRLSSAGAKVIALDLVFSEPSRRDEKVDLSAEDGELATAMARAGNVVAGYYFRPSPGARHGPMGGDPANIEPSAIEQVLGDPPEGFIVPGRPAVEPNLDLFAQAASSQGFFSKGRSSTGVLRDYDLVIRHSGRYYPALALRAAERFLGGQGLRLEPRDGRVAQVLLAGEPVAANDHLALRLNYRGPARSYPTRGVVEVLEGRMPAGAFAGMLVFVGANEPGIGDFQTSPFGSEIPGVEVHAHAADNLLNGDALSDRGPQNGLSLLALFVLGPAVALVVARGKPYRRGAFFALGVVAAWPLVAFAAFQLASWHLQTVGPALAGLAALVFTLPYQIGWVDRRGRQVRRLFERYVAPAVVEELLQDPEGVRLGGERRVMTVLFSDIRGFTDLSEELDPTEVTRLLNAFFTPMTRVVLATGGTLDKYMGDALMAFFGAPVAHPDHAARACRAALGMRAELERLKAGWQKSGAFPRASGLGVGIGIATGEMSVGNMGSEDVFSYTVIGDSVNLGSRIEGLNKLYGTSILLAESTARAAGEGFLCREVDRVRVKGKKVAVTLFELVAEGSGTPEERRLVERFAAGLARYHAADFAGALALFEGLEAEGLEDGPNRLYLERCRRFLQHPPPADWDGVETLTSK